VTVGRRWREPEVAAGVWLGPVSPKRGFAWVDKGYFRAFSAFFSRAGHSQALVSSMTPLCHFGSVWERMPGWPLGAPAWIFHTSHEWLAPPTLGRRRATVGRAPACAQAGKPCQHGALQQQARSVQMPPMKDSLPSAEAGRLDNTPKRDVVQTCIITC